MPNQPPSAETSAIVRHAISIWETGVAAVTPRALIANKIFRDGSWLVLDERTRINLATTGRLILVGAGKASAAMAIEFLDQHCTDWNPEFAKVIGWINAPEGSFDASLVSDQGTVLGQHSVHLHVARPVGTNLPTQQAVEGTQRIIQLVRSANHNDVVICLLSGGGSALLVAPQPGISLSDKQAIAKMVAAAGGNIVQLNTIRRCLSQVKGGGLAKICRAGKMVSLVISDVLGDPLDLIASGPTYLSPSYLGDTYLGEKSSSSAARSTERSLDTSEFAGESDIAQALSILRDLRLQEIPELQSVVRWLKQAQANSQNVQCVPTSGTQQPQHIILGNLADAVDAAGVRAVELGYRYLMQVAREVEGDVGHVAENACSILEELSCQPDIDCWISGGEPTVVLPQGSSASSNSAMGSRVGKGGRNQHLCLELLHRLARSRWPERYPNLEVAFLSGGTDGEDGPTDAAGAWFDRRTLQTVVETKMDLLDYLNRADSYSCFSRLGSLLMPGPTGTNVCDLRVALVRPKRS